MISLGAGNRDSVRNGSDWKRLILREAQGVRRVHSCWPLPLHVSARYITGDAIDFGVVEYLDDPLMIASDELEGGIDAADQFSVGGDGRGKKDGE